MKKNLLVTLADKNFIEQAKQLFSSVYWNAGWKGDYMLLAHEIPEKDLKWFNDKGILVKRCKPLYNSTIGKSKHPPATLSKFYLFTPEFKKWQNIIFLDADIIVRASLEALTKIKGFVASYATHSLFRNWKLIDQFTGNSNKKIYARLKENYDSNVPSFNTGVMVINTAVIGKETYSEFNALLKIYGKMCLYGEEGITNLFLYKKWKKLSQIYNLRPDHVMKYAHVKPQNIRGVVLHFVGKDNRPWHPSSYFYNEWKRNLVKADLVDLKKIISPAKKWKKLEIIIYLLHIKLRVTYSKVCSLLYQNLYLKLYYNIYLKIRSQISTLIKSAYLNLKKGFLKVDSMIGLIGIFLKKYTPASYSKIRELKKKLGLK